jgi:hypothetical protein
VGSFTSIFWKRPRQRPVLLEDAAVFLVGGGADALQLARGQHGLDQVGGVHDTARGGARTDDGVDLVDEQHRALAALELGEHALEALLEVAPVLGAGHQRAQVEGVDHRIREDVRDLTVHDLLGQTLGDGGLADAGLTHVQGVVLAPAAQDLHRALHLVGTADQRVDLAQARLLVEVGCVGFQRVVALRLLAFRGGFLLRGVLLGMLFGHLGDAVGDVVDHVQAGHVVLAQQVDRVGLLFTEDGHQHVGAGHLLAAGGLHVEHRPLQHALEAERGLRVARILRRQTRRIAVHELRQFHAQLVQVHATGAHHGRGGGVLRQGEQKMLHGDELVSLLARGLEGHVEGEFEFFVQHGFLPRKGHYACFHRAQ